VISLDANRMIAAPHVILSAKRTIASIFSAADQGFAFIPSRTSSLFQDTAGTVPVTADGQTVALWRDVSGKGNHATQATSGSRPTYREGRARLALNGSTNWMQTAPINWGTDEVTIVAAVRKMSDAARGTVVELTTDSGTQNGAWALFAPAAATPTYGARGRGTSASFATSPMTFAAPVTSVVAARIKISANSTVLRVNGVDTTSGAALGSGLFANAAIYIGSTGGASNRFNGDLYPLIGINRLLTAGELAFVEDFAASEAGL
jgi:hypothetical protein